MTAVLTPSAPVPSSVARPKMATDIPATITTPNVVQTRLGTLSFFDGLPDAATVETVSDNLDFQRGVQAFLTALPAASLFATRAAIRSFGPDNQTMLITESLMDSHTLILTANTETVYTLGRLDTHGLPDPGLVLATAQSAPDEEERTAAIYALNEVLIEHVHGIPVHPRSQVTAVSTHVGGFVPHPLQYENVVQPGMTVG